MSGVEGRFAGSLGGFRLEAEFHLEPTGITALSGPSGSGKTSLLRCIAGLTRLPGRLSIDGEIWQDERAFLPPHRRPVGVVFQEPSLLSHLSVRGNLEYGAQRAKTADLDETIELLGLAPMLARSTGALSGGERQRVALGRALVMKPRLLLMDEPLSSLDADAKAEILPYLERWRRALAIPVLYISHDAGEIARLADRVLLMAGGKVAPGEAARRGDLASLTSAERDALALAALRAGLTA
jgi:molybdate transport system ATP-binding protein